MTTPDTDAPTIHLGATTDAGDLVRLPVQRVLTGRAAIFGKSGSGKSNTANVVVENLLAGEFPVLIVDTEGEYWGLQEQYQLLRAGADDDCDVQVGPEHGEWLATKALVDEVPVILDLSGYFDEAEARDLVADVAKHLYHKENEQQKPFLLVLEEAHNFVPQQGGMDDCAQILVKVAKQGRKRGLGAVCISQRPASVNKDFVTQCDWLVWHRLTWQNDVKVVRRVMGSDYADAVDDLGDGEAFLRADWDDTVHRVQVRRQETFDAGATPDLEGYDRPELKTVGEDIQTELEEISAEYEQREDELERKGQRIQNLEQQVEDLQDQLALAREVNKQVEANLEVGGVEATLEELAVDRAEIEEMVALDDGEDLTADDLASLVEDLEAQLAQSEERREALQADLDRLRDERDRLQNRVADLEAELEQRAAPAEYEALVSDLREVVDRNGDVLDVDVDASDREQQLRDRVAELEAELEAARDAPSGQGEPSTGDGDRLIDHEAIRTDVEMLIENSSYDDRHFWDVLEQLARASSDETLHPDDIAPFTAVGEDSVADVLRTFEDAGLVKAVSQGRRKEYELHTEVLEQRIQTFDRRRERAVEVTGP